MPHHNRTQDIDCRLAEERHHALQGSAKIRLSQLDIGPKWELNEKKLESLRQAFRRNGVYPHQSENHVEVIISRQDLEQALEKCGLTAHDFRMKGPENHPVLDFAGRQLRCLHGKHRVQAVRDALPLTKWWIADIYLDSQNS